MCFAVRTPEVKLVTYSKWAHGTTRPIPASMQVEFYDYARRRGGRRRTASRTTRGCKPLMNKLFGEYTSTQMEAPLPLSLRSTVLKARASYIAFNAVTNAYGFKQLIPQQKLRTVLGYGGNF